MENRNLGIDNFRILACLAVICIHSYPFRGSTLGIFIQSLCEFAVPFFFITSGYFYGKSGKLKKTLLKLLSIYAFWFLFYALITPNSPKYIAHYGLIGGLMRGVMWDTLQIKLTTLILEGTSVHLWFFPALIASIALVELCKSVKYLDIIFGALLYLWGIYLNNSHLLILFAPLFVGIGYEISGMTKPKIVSLSLIFAFAGMNFFVRGSYNLITISIATCVFLYALGIKGFKEGISKHTLGIYGVHVIVWQAVRLFPYKETLVFNILVVPFIFLTSLFLTIVFSVLLTRLRRNSQD